MPAERFFDTNILIHAFAANDSRSARAEALIADGGVIGVQVLNEFTNVTRRKLTWDWKQVEAALGVIEDLLGPVRPLTAEIHAEAVTLAHDHRLSFYDALIVAAAADAGCRRNRPLGSVQRDQLRACRFVSMSRKVKQQTAGKANCRLQESPSPRRLRF